MTRGNNRLQERARDLQAELDIPYTEALMRAKGEALAPDTPRRWVLNEQVEAVFRGEGIRGIDTADPRASLYTWLETERSPAGECHWCEQWVDSRQEPACVQINFFSYDPDMMPRTGMLNSTITHERCKPSAVHWLVRVPEEGDPYQYEATFSGDFQADATIAISARTVMPMPRDEQYPDQMAMEDGPNPAVLVLIPQIIDDQGAGAASWLNVLEADWKEMGMVPVGEEPLGECTMSVRIVTEYPNSNGRSYLFVREATDQDGNADEHVYVGMLELPESWLAVVAEQAEVCVVCGPLADFNQAPDPQTGELAQDRLTWLMQETNLIYALVPATVEQYKPWPRTEAATPAGAR